MTAVHSERMEAVPESEQPAVREDHGASTSMSPSASDHSRDGRNSYRLNGTDSEIMSYTKLPTPRKRFHGSNGNGPRLPGHIAPLYRRNSGKSPASVSKMKKYRQLASAPSTPLDVKDAWIDVGNDDDRSRRNGKDHFHASSSPKTIVQPSPIRSQPMALNGNTNGGEPNPPIPPRLAFDEPDAVPPRPASPLKTPRMDQDAFPPAAAAVPPASAPPKVPLAHDLKNLKPTTLASALRLQQVQTGGVHDRDKFIANGLQAPNANNKPSNTALAPSKRPSGEVRISPTRRASSGGVFDSDRMTRDLELFRAKHKPQQAASMSATKSNGGRAKATTEQPPPPPPPAASSSSSKKPPARPPPAPAPSPTESSTPLAPFSLWEYLKEEVLATDFDSTQEMKWERVTNFVAVPWWVESIILFGFVICLDSFLYTFTILPLRCMMAVYLWVSNNVRAVLHPSTPHSRLHSSHKCDILKTALVVCSCYILSRVTDASKMYHSVRGQDVIKLYVIFNVMEILDRLCCSLGQDLLDALFSRMTLGRRKDGSQPLARPIAFFLLALVYIQLHTMVLFYQLVTLNVAINSYDNALLTLLLSNQFVEIKGAVFKKFEKENLFQMTCADIVERFQLALILTAIGVRNLIEVSGGMGGGSGGEVPLPRSFTFLPSISVIETSFAPVAIVLVSECLVDWLKHAFITKFNHIRPAVYGRFMDVLCRDLVVGGPTPSSQVVADTQAAPPAAKSSAPAAATTTAATSGSHQSPPPPMQPAGSSAQQENAQQPAPTASSSAAASAALAAQTARSKRRHTFVDQSPIVSRRLGFAALPLACLLVRVSVQIWGMLADDSHFDECAASGGGSPSKSSTITRGAFASNGTHGSETEFGGSVSWWHVAISLAQRLMGFKTGNTAAIIPYLDGAVQFLAWSLTLVIGWVFLVAVKLLLGTFLIAFATKRYRTMTAREAEEELNARDRVPIGVDKGEREYEAKGKRWLEQNDGSAAAAGGDAAAAAAPPQATTKKPAAGSNLMDVNRYTMIKSRLW